MNQQEILKKIGGIIAELNDQYTYLEAAGNEFNDLELELFMANANFLTDHIQILKKVHGQLNPVTLPLAAPVLPVEKVYGKRQEIPDYFDEEEQSLYAEDQIPVTILNVPATNDLELQSPEVTEPEIVKSESIILSETKLADEVNESPAVEDASFTEQKIADPEIPAEEVIVPKVEVIPEAIVEPEIKVQPKIQSEPVVFIEEKQPEPIKQEFLKIEPTKPQLVKPETEPGLTLNERIAAQKGLEQSKSTIAETPNKLRITQDLQSMISLNDKLLFVKELFNGYSLAYTEAINILNRYTDFKQAEQFLNSNYAVKNNWKEKPVVSEQFFDLLRKKFSQV